MGLSTEPRQTVAQRARWPENRPPDWRDFAACHGAGVDMVPDPGDTSSVQLAKKLCRQCPVQIACLLAADRIAQRYGPGYAHGVWGGLTQQERDTMVGLNRWPAPCTRCGLDCVPVNLSTTECSSCRPSAIVHYDDYRDQITRMVEAGRTYGEIAVVLRLTRIGVAGACARWNIKPAARTAVVRTSVQPCGTEAAKYRHQRKWRKTQDPADSYEACPLCRNVLWSSRKK